MKKYAYGVDIGGTSIKIGLFSAVGTLISVWEIPTNKDNLGAMIFPDIAQAIETHNQKNQSAKEEIEGIGVGAPGPVSEDGIVYKCVNLGWDIVKVEEQLSCLTGGIKVKVGNDANVAALGEMWKGGGRGYKNVVMITLGTGIGGGIVHDGRIVSGANGAAGEIGHLPMNDDETETCGCGRRGCLEQYASADGLVKTTVKYLQMHKEETTSLKALDHFSAKDICDAAQAGDRVAQMAVSSAMRLLGKGMAMISCVENPEVFVIGGGLSKAGDIIIGTAKKYFQEYAFHASRETEVKSATLGNLAGIYGGAKMVLE